MSPSFFAQQLSFMLEIDCKMCFVIVLYWFIYKTCKFQGPVSENCSSVVPKTTKLIHPWSGLFSPRLLWSALSCHGLAPTACQSVLPGRENISSRLLMIINFSPVKFMFKDYAGSSDEPTPENGEDCWFMGPHTHTHTHTHPTFMHLKQHKGNEAHTHTHTHTHTNEPHIATHIHTCMHTHTHTPCSWGEL